MTTTISADNGSVSGSAGLKSSADSSGILAFQTGANTTAVTIDASQNVGIGTASPVTGNSKLTVITGVTAQDGTTPALQLYNTGAGADQKYLRIVSTSTGTLNFEKVNDAYSSATGLFGATSAGLFQFNSGYGSVATAYGCRAWVNFNGTGTVAIRASGNVTSITDNGVGEYTVNFTTAISDANYSYSLSTRHQSGVCRGIVLGSSTTTPQTSSFRIENYDLVSGAVSLKDVDYICVAIFR